VDHKAFISGCAGLALDDDERRYFAESRPCGLILFRRNCGNPEQIRTLIADFKASVASDEILVLIDQEGGRVERLKPPHWLHLPPAACYGRLYDADPAMAARAAFAGARLTAEELYDLGITVNTMPVLDVPQEGAHDIIGDRAYATNPETVIDLGSAVIEGCLSGGVLPVIKHVPGHGRAGADSHLALPCIDAGRSELEAVDFRPFRALRHAPLAMTAHVLMPAFDDRRPSSVSPVIMGEVIRNLIGLTGLVMSDDLGMKALGGSFAERARGVIEAGCDLALHCSGNLDEMKEVAGAVPPLNGIAAERFANARAHLRAPEPFDAAEAMALVTEAAGTQVASLGRDPTVPA
jgi:beta-N-acetylhexosaminidase